MIHEATAATSVVMTMARPAVPADLARAWSTAFTGFVLAMTWPVTRTSVICIEKASRLKKPSPQ